eukprot:gb/GEZN01023348.1/.p1 GENE.gb/GEZN01023348.1/~~gb/GEZN01023348.1/.p1  ORF type:complete len:121 (-),score=2.80 gb/GEZN01023348.1/:83-445(-)
MDLSTFTCAAFFSAERSVFLDSSEKNSASLPLSALGLAKKSSPILDTSTLEISTRVEVPITYAWFTLRSGTPLILYGPVTSRSRRVGSGAHYADMVANLRSLTTSGVWLPGSSKGHSRHR